MENLCKRGQMRGRVGGRDDAGERDGLREREECEAATRLKDRTH